jgi:hypothetical protein
LINNDRNIYLGRAGFSLFRIKRTFLAPFLKSIHWFLIPVGTFAFLGQEKSYWAEFCPFIKLINNDRNIYLGKTIWN